jgi:hypothetical protein
MATDLVIVSRVAAGRAVTLLDLVGEKGGLFETPWARSWAKCRLRYMILGDL